MLICYFRQLGAGLMVDLQVTRCTVALQLAAGCPAIGRTLLQNSVVHTQGSDHLLSVGSFRRRPLLTV